MAVPLVTVLAFGACGGDDDGGSDTSGTSARAAGGAASSGDAAVEIANFEFEPQTVVVKPGTRVTWTNGDTAIHSVKDTSPMATPTSKDLAEGETFSISYDTPGSFSYICGIHQYMTGQIDVVA